MNTQAENIIPIQNNLVSEDIATSNVSAFIREINAGDVLIEYKNELIKATPAFSCFIQPMINDQVLVSFDQHQQAFIIAILKREHADQMTMELPAKTTINSREQITLTSQSISQLAQKQVNKSSEYVTEFDRAIIKGNSLHSHIGHLHTISDVISTMAKQAIQKFSSYVRKSDTSDQVQAAQMSRKIDGLYSMNSKHTIMTSQKDTKIDGEHIHMG